MAAAASTDAIRRRARLVLGLGVVFGIGYLAYWLLLARAGAGINFEVYRAAGAALWEGSQVYGVSPVGDTAFIFRYPPIALVPISVYLLVGPGVGYLAHAAGTMAVGLLLGLALARAVESHGVGLEPVDRGLIAGFVTVGPFAAPSLLYGNVNHHVALAVGIGLLWLADGYETRAGVAVGAAALLKVFPAGVGVWFLHQRAWRALAAALATGVGGLALGAVLFGLDRTRAFVETVLLARAAPDAFAGGLPATSEYVTLLRPLSLLFPDLGVAALTLVAIALLSPVVGYCYRHEDGPTDRLLALFATLAALLLVLPSFSLYFLILAYPLVVLLYVLPGRVGTLFAAGTALSLLTLKLPDVATVLGGFPSAIADPLYAGAVAVYTLGTPVLWGSLAMLGACLVHVRSHG